MKKARKDKTIAEKLDLLGWYKMFSLLSQCEAAERLGVRRRLLHGLIKNEATLCAAASSVSGEKWKRLRKDEEVKKALLISSSLLTRKMSQLTVPFLWKRQIKLLKWLGIQTSRPLKDGFNQWKKRFSVEFVILKG